MAAGVDELADCYSVAVRELFRSKILPGAPCSELSAVAIRLSTECWRDDDECRGCECEGKGTGLV